MFRFTERILKSCGSGCQVLWSDPNKQSSGYDSVKKDVDEEFMEEDNFEGTLENDPLTGAIIMAQPSASASSSGFVSVPIWSEDKLAPPIVKNNTSAISKDSHSNKQRASSSGYTSSFRHDSNFNAPIVKNSQVVKHTFSSKQKGDKMMSPHETNKTEKKLSKKEKSEQVKMQIVSTV